MHTHTPWERLTLAQTMQVSAQMRHCSAVAQELQYNKTTWWNESSIQKRPPATTYPHLTSLLTSCLPYSLHCLTLPQGITYSTSCVNMLYCSSPTNEYMCLWVLCTTSFPGLSHMLFNCMLQAIKDRKCEWPGNKAAQFSPWVPKSCFRALCKKSMPNMAVWDEASSSPPSLVLR